MAKEKNTSDATFKSAPVHAVHVNIYADMPVTLQHATGEPHFPAGRALWGSASAAGAGQPLPSGTLQALAPEQSQCLSWGSALHGCAPPGPGTGAHSLVQDWELWSSCPEAITCSGKTPPCPCKVLLWIKNGLNPSSLRQMFLSSRAATLCKEAQIWRSFPCQEWPKEPLVPGAQ